MAPLVVVGAVACTSVLGLDDYQDAVEGLCKCNQHFRWTDDCVGLVTTRLQSARSETRSGWLTYYAEHCAGTCDHAFECFQQPPTCAAQGFGCEADEECCGYAEGGEVHCSSANKCEP